MAVVPPPPWKSEYSHVGQTAKIRCSLSPLFSLIWIWRFQLYFASSRWSGIQPESCNGEDKHAMGAVLEESSSCLSPWLRAQPTLVPVVCTSSQRRERTWATSVAITICIGSLWDVCICPYWYFLVLAGQVAAFQLHTDWTYTMKCDMNAISGAFNGEKTCMYIHIPSIVLFAPHTFSEGEFFHSTLQIPWAGYKHTHQSEPRRRDSWVSL